MNRNVLSAALILGLPLLVVGLSGCQPSSPGTNREAAKPAPTTEPVNKAAIETELLQLEREWTASTLKHDVEAIKRIEADDIVMTYPDGTAGTKADEVRDAEAKALTADSWDIADAKVTVLNADAAIISGRSTLKNGKFKGTDGRTIDISGQYRFTDVFAKRNGKWQVVASQTTKLLNPVATPSPAASASPATAPAPPVQASPAAKAAPSKPTP